MKTKFEHIDLIERYLDDDLSETEMQKFQHLLNTDAEFNKLFFEMDSLIEGIRQAAKATSVDEKFAALESSLPLKKKHDQKNLLGNWFENISAYWGEIWIGFSGISIQARAGLVVATLSIIISVPFIFDSLNSMPPSSLYEAYFLKPDYTFGYTARSYDKGDESDLTGEELFDQGIAAYKDFNYGQALSYFNLINDNELRDKVNFFSGICLMSTDQFLQAKIKFDLVIQNPDSYWSGQAAYFLGLCYLHEEELDKALPLLQSVAEDDENDYREQARQIMKKL